MFPRLNFFIFVHYLLSLIIRNEKKDFKFYNFIGLVDDEFVPVVGKVTANTDGEIEISDYVWLELEDIPKQKNLHWGVRKLYDKAKVQLKKIVDDYCG